MKKFLNEDFLLSCKTAQTLYNDFAGSMPIFDYHSHLPANEIAADKRFENLTEIWLKGDHYKWRAMRANGVNEEYITGMATDQKKFEKWAETVPYALRNPLYHWTHLELQRYFGISDLLNPESADAIYSKCNEFLHREEFSVRNLLRKMQVKVVCTTDDPLDTLPYHWQMKKEGLDIKVLPTFRPDNAMKPDDARHFNEYVNNLEALCNKSISTFADYLEALKQRHDFFHETGCRIADHGLDHLFSQNFTEKELAVIFLKLRAGEEVSAEESYQFKSGMLYYFSLWHFEKGWVQQYHLGALRNNSLRLLKQVGADSGVDSIGDFQQATALSRFLQRLDMENKLAKTILYNLNPADNAVIATMAGNFNDGSIPGKIQFGAAWWFLDQKEGIIDQLNTLSNMGLVSRFVGMLTDSRSFLSFPRHEYFRRILCNLFGSEIEKGELPHDLEWTGKIIQDICYNNASNYFNIS